MTASADLERVAQIRERDRQMYREGQGHLQVREDVHFLLKHLDDLLERVGGEKATADNGGPSP